MGVKKVTLYWIIVSFLVLVLQARSAMFALKVPIFVGNTDTIDYYLNALFLSKHGFLKDSFWPSTYYIYLSVLGSVFGFNEAPLKVLNSLILTPILFLSYLILKNIFEGKHKLIFIVFLAMMLLDSEFLFFTSTFYKEPFFVFLMLLSIYFYQEYFKSRKDIHLISFILFTVMGANINSWLILLVPTLYLHLLYVGWRDKKLVWKNEIILLGKFALFFFLFSAPFAFLYWNANGGYLQFFPSNSMDLLFLMNAPSGCEGVRFSNVDNNRCPWIENIAIDYASSKGIDWASLNRYEKSKIKFEYISSYLINNPGTLIAKIPEFLYLWLIPSHEETQRAPFMPINSIYFMYFTWILAIFGIYAYLKERKDANLVVPVVSAYFSMSLAYWASYYLYRFRFLFLPFELFFASYGVVYLLQRFGVSVEGLLAKLEKADLDKKVYILVIVVSLLIVWYLLSPYYQLRYKLSITSILELIPEKASVFLPNSNVVPTRLLNYSKINLTNECFSGAYVIYSATSSDKFVFPNWVGDVAENQELSRKYGKNLQVSLIHTENYLTAYPVVPLKIEQCQ